MIVGLIGVVERISALEVHLEVHGVVYRVQVSMRSSASLQVGKEVRLKILQVIKEDAHLLYGFLEESEKILFERLLKINGVGGRIALAILSSFSPNEFENIIATKEVKALQQVPGIGKKLADKIMVDLIGFFIQDEMKPAQNEVFLALESLGFKNTEISKVLKTLKPNLSTEMAIKEALQQLHS
ncbi:Holliday junction branch migration protein RuvA [Helicobacter cetorum]|uniref:Holliday junction branch migration complex subunit RuvA n=1 Tax=Helicobacter cetorum (strain ATCC BAA-540 / CCUG 52418 / MIT 99-5656) TaxID=1163745 RepID=I0ER34_HELCM|nr:Holliday junction branch migration protein RuvA [Helicobacter cetorum]AFI05403.1 Holliday junction DNA helicase RuvA [Helicobacter cetorum MIT 99-5656]